MTACNERPPEGHPFHGTGVACHFTRGHAAPHAWDIEEAERKHRAFQEYLVTGEVPEWRQRELEDRALRDSLREARERYT